MRTAAAPTVVDRLRRQWARLLTERENTGKPIVCAHCPEPLLAIETWDLTEVEVPLGHGRWERQVRPAHTACLPHPQA